MRSQPDSANDVQAIATAQPHTRRQNGFEAALLTGGPLLANRAPSTDFEQA